MDGGVGIDELMLAAKRAYLREAMQAVSRQGGRANISRLSVATGMTRKEVSALLSASKENRTVEVRKSGQQRALRVLSGWLTDSRFQTRNGRPRELSYRSNDRSFAALVKLYGGDVTAKSVLRELERIGVVDWAASGKLRLRSTRSRGNIELNYKLSDLARMFEDFAFSVVRSNDRLNAPSFFGFKDSEITSIRDAAYLMRKFSRRAAALLEDFQQWTDARGPIKSAANGAHQSTRVGLGIYMLNSDLKVAANATRNSPGKRTGRGGNWR